MRNDLHSLLLSSIECSYNIKGLGLLCHLLSSMDRYILQARHKPQMTTIWAKREISKILAIVCGWIYVIRIMLWYWSNDQGNVQGKSTGVTILLDKMMRIITKGSLWVALTTHPLHFVYQKPQIGEITIVKYYIYFLAEFSYCNHLSPIRSPQTIH